MSNISEWSSTAASNNAEAPDGFKENMFPSQVNDSAREVMAAVRVWYDDVEWRNWGHTVTFASATTFTIATDVTAIYVANRPIRCTDATTLYGYVASSSYSSPNTTVTVTLDSGSLSASLTAVALGPTPSTQSIPVQAIRNQGSALLAASNNWTGSNMHTGDNAIKDTVLFYDPADTTKKIRFDAGSVSTAITRVVTVPDRDITLADPLTSGTAIATTSGTSHDFTGIPSWVKKITINLAGVSTNGTSVPLIQIGDSGGIETTGYLGSGVGIVAAAVGATAYTTGFGLDSDTVATAVSHGSLVLSLENSATNTWSASGVLGRSDIARISLSGGSKALSATLDRVRLTTVNGTDTFDGGSVNILYE